ncbi:hypothetical protein CQ019_01385 [Arthrobacter sp. MYb229]|uniref:endonuclease/exonuclease/phosphatase family protein n=1 Tax=unclassified Glutamicibacter TaxID=2627139 RepID=UPI000CFC0108|nr:hypothetical protein CQ019_01385 [Arthrobacter sp. MYb229]PRB52996.1 hypothetical protein CQ013_01385 [Arthrobacter sp. MYb216]
MPTIDLQKRKKTLWIPVVLLSLLISGLAHIPWLAGGVLPKVQAASLWLLLIPLAALVYACWRRKLFPGAVLLLAIIIGLQPYLQFNPPAGTDPGPALKVFSFNTYKAQADPAELAREISSEDPDVLVLVETSEPLHESLAARGAMTEYLYRTAPAPADGNRDTVIFSKLPLTQAETELSTEETGWFSMPTVLIEVQGQQVQLAGVHVYPPLDKAETWEQGLRSVEKWIETHGENPVILAGDFNATRGHPQYRRAVQGLDEASGFVPAATWPATRLPSPVIEIDHIISRGFTVSETKATRMPGSDHLALSATLHLKPPASP